MKSTSQRGSLRALDSSKPTTPSLLSLTPSNRLTTLPPTTKKEMESSDIRQAEHPSSTSEPEGSQSGDLARYRLLTDVSVHTIVSDDNVSTKLKELCVHGLSDSNSDCGRCFALESGKSEGVWKMRGCLDLPYSSHQVIVSLRNMQGEDVGEVRLVVDATEWRQQHTHSALESSRRSGREVRWELEAVECGIPIRISFTETIVDSRELAEVLCTLGSSSHRCFQNTGSIADLTEAISFKKRAVDITPPDHPDAAERLGDLGYCYYSRFARNGERGDIDTAISLEKRALDNTPDGDPHLAARLTTLGGSLYARFQHSGHLADLNEAISLELKAIEKTSECDPDRAARLASLGDSYCSRFHHVGDLKDLTEAISLIQRAVDSTHDDHPELPDRLASLGAAYHSRFKRIGELLDLNKSILLNQRSVEKTPDDHPELACRIAWLGASFYTRFQRTGDLSDLIDAISLERRALKMTADDDPDLPYMLAGLGASLATLFYRTGRLADLTEAISLERRALDLTPEDHPAFAKRLKNLGNSFYARFRSNGELEDLNEAIALEQRAVEITSEGHPDLPKRLEGLGASFYARFHHGGELADLTEAISLERRAIDSTPSGHPDMAKRLTGLGFSLQARFDRIGDLGDLTEAIALKQTSLDITPDGHPALADRLASLGTSFYALYQRKGDINDLDKAILLEQKAIKNTPENHPDLARKMDGLGASLFARFRRNGDAPDITNALSLAHSALEITPPGHPNTPHLLFSLGNYYSTKYSSPRGAPADLSAAISHYKSAATSSLGWHDTRLAAAKCWARILQDHFPGSSDLLPAFEATLSQSALSIGLGQTLGRRYSVLTEVSGVLPAAVAAALACGRVEKALEWLEQGRCLVWGQLNSLRAPLDELRVHHSALACRLSTLSQALDVAGSSRAHSHHGKSITEKISLETEARIHQNLAKERDELIAQARALPGFERFLLPPSHSTLLRGLPPSGYVIVVNAHEDRCDALVLSAGRTDALHVPLSGFSLRKAKRARDGLKDSYDRYHLRMRGGIDGGDTMDDRGLRLVRTVNAAMTALLKGLWIDLVKPIFDAIGLKKIPPASGELYPRIWWCPTGILSFLPIHAAGIYDANAEHSIVSALDYVVSSYTPTVTSLASRVGNQRPVSEGVSGLLITSQPNPGPTVAPAIPGTTKEAQSIFAGTCEDGARVLKLEGDEVTIDAFLDHMERFSSVHLACHGSQNADDPLSSRFLFHHGSLELRLIIRKDLHHADLAFLSACQTSTGEEKLADEAVHLAAGMLAAGYRRVLATMWSIGDNEAPQVAQDVYDYILNRREEGALGGFDGTHSAEALHYAIQRLRSRLDNSDRSLLAWAPYVHWGY